MGGCGSRNDEVSLYRKKQKISLPGMCQTISFNFDATLLAASFFNSDASIYLPNFLIFNLKNDKWLLKQQYLDANINITFLQFSQKENILISAHEDHSINLWNMNIDQSFAIFQSITAHTDIINQVSFSPSEDLIISAGVDQFIMVFHCQDKWTQKQQLKIEQEDFTPILCFALNSEQTILATGQCSQIITIYSLIEDVFQKTQEIRVDNHYNQSVCFSPLETILVIGSIYGSDITVVDQELNVNRTLSSHIRGVKGLAFSENGILGSISQDCSLKLWSNENKFHLIQTIQFQGITHNLVFKQNYLAVQVGLNDLYIYVQLNKN